MSMQRAFADAQLKVPPGATDASWITELSERALELRDILGSTDAVAHDLLATAVSVEQRAGRAVDPGRIANQIAQARTRMGWKEADLAAFFQTRAQTLPENTLPIEAALAVGQMGRGAGVSANAMNEMMNRTISRVDKGQRDQQTWAMVDLERQGLTPGKILGDLGSGNIAGYLAQLKEATDAGTSLRDLGDGNLFASEEDIALTQYLINNMNRFGETMANVRAVTAGGGESLKTLIDEGDRAKPLFTAMENAYTALENAFTLMADAGVLSALVSLMNTIAGLVNWFNNLPAPIHQLIALFVRINIWMGVITSTLTVLMGLTIAYIMYLWGMSFVLKIVFMLITNFAGALGTVG